MELQETPPQVKQTATVVGNKVFIITQKICTEYKTGKEFVTLETTRPYPGTIEDFAKETQGIIDNNVVAHEQFIAEKQAQLEVAKDIIATETAEAAVVDKMIAEAPVIEEVKPDAVEIEETPEGK